MLGRHLSEVVGPAAYESIRPHVEAVLAGRRVELELEIPYQDLGPRWMHLVYVPDRQPDGEVAGFVGVMTDVTQRKHVERQVARARDEALAASHAKDDFLAALSHELRTPLNPVLLIASDAAEDRSLPPEARADFETIRKHVELEARLIDDLLDLTAITRGKLSLEQRKLALHAVLRDAITTVAPEMEQKRIRLLVQTRALEPVIMGDPVRLQQVLWNVLKNAVKFTPENGSIHVETSTLEGRVQIVVRDTGIGLTPSELERIFDAFAQGDHAGDGGSHRFGGLGLGLAISRMVIELHRGSIRATSEGRGHGASFVIELPLVAAPDAAGMPPDNPPAEPIAPLADGHRHQRILLVEDHVATRAALERLLTRRNFTVCSAGTLADARVMVDSNQFDLVISDVGLPDGSGYDLMQEVGARFGLRGIALTGYGAEQDLARSQQAGFSVHLTKPVRVQALDAALAQILAK
jgi:signal transduction histidine kinase